MSLLLLFHGAGAPAGPQIEIGIGASVDRPGAASMAQSLMTQATLGQSAVTGASIAQSAVTRAALGLSGVTKAAISVELIED